MHLQFRAEPLDGGNRAIRVVREVLVQATQACQVVLKVCHDGARGERGGKGSSELCLSQAKAERDSKFQAVVALAVLPLHKNTRRNKHRNFSATSVARWQAEEVSSVRKRFFDGDSLRNLNAPAKWGRFSWIRRLGFCHQTSRKTAPMASQVRVDIVSPR